MDQISPNIKITEIANYNGKSRFYVSNIPGKKKDLERDLIFLQSINVKVIVCLVGWSELYLLGLSDYPRRVQEHGFIFYHLPVVDSRVPELTDLTVINSLLLNHASKEENILIHCREGHGRAGTVVACVLTHFGFNDQEAIDITRKRRRGAISNQLQTKFIHHYYNSLMKR